MANSYKLDICRWKNNYKLFQPNISRNGLTDNSRMEKLYHENKELELLTEVISKEETDYRYQKASMWGDIRIEEKIITEINVVIGGFYLELSSRIKQNKLIEILRIHFKKSNNEYGIYEKEELDNIAMIKPERSMFEMKSIESMIQARLWGADIIENRKWKTGFGFSKNMNFKKNLVKREEVLEEVTPIVCKIARRFGENSAEEDMMERYLKAVKDWHYILPPDVMKQIFLDIKKYKKGKHIKKMLEKFVKRITLMDGSESRSKEAILCIPFI